MKKMFLYFDNLIIAKSECFKYFLLFFLNHQKLTCENCELANIKDEELTSLLSNNEKILKT